MKSLILAGALLSAGAASAETLYSNDFNAGLGDVTLSGGATVRTDNGVTYIGNMTRGGSASLTLDTTGYSSVTLAFTLYAVRSLDGNGQAGGAADPFVVTSNGTTAFNYTFANYSANTQSYGGAGVPAGAFAPRTGSSSTNDLGFGGAGNDFGDTTYLLSGITLTPVDGVLRLTLTGNSNQDVGDEFYGIDNLVITGSREGAVPEPATWAMMLSGFGLVGAAARRRRRTTALA